MTALLVFAICWLVGAAVLWLVVLPWLSRGLGCDPASGFLWRVARVYAWLWHRPTYSGTELLPQSADDHEGLIIVSNHTGALDPLLIQGRCRFLIRWMMAADFAMPAIDWFWQPKYIIPVDRSGTDSAPLREAIRHVRGGGVIGIFPEGRITWPPRQIRPFLAGVGVLIARTKTPVIVTWVSGTPDTNLTGQAYARRSHARVVFIDRMTFDDERDPTVITERLRHRIHEASGWPLNDEVQAPGRPPEPPAH